MFQNILLSYDGSEHAMNAAKLAAVLAGEQAQPFLWVVCVVEDTPDLLSEPYQTDWISRHSAQGEALLNEAAQLVGDKVEVRRELLFGEPAGCITNVAETRGCDLIIMGTRGLSPFSGLLLGSKAQKVISQAKCPVLVTR